MYPLRAFILGLFLAITLGAGAQEQEATAPPPTPAEQERQQQEGQQQQQQDEAAPRVVVPGPTGALTQVTPDKIEQAIEIVTPKAGVELKQNFVHVVFSLKQPIAAASQPRFELRMDAQEAVRTAATEHTFTGLTPGRHRLVIELIDANDLPISGSRSEIEFSVAGQQRQGTGTRQQPPPAETPATSEEKPRLLTAAWVSSPTGPAPLHEAAQEETPAQTQTEEAAEPAVKRERRQQADDSDLPYTATNLPLLSLLGLGMLLGGMLAARQTRPRS